MIMTAHEFALAISAKGHRIGILDGADEHSIRDDLIGVNVWRDPLDRYPADTVWFNRETGEVDWGPNFDYEAHAQDPDLVQRVLDTINPSEEKPADV